MWKSLAAGLIAITVACAANAQQPPRPPQVVVTAEPGAERELALLLEHLAALGFDFAMDGAAPQAAGTQARIRVRQSGAMVEVWLIDAASGVPSLKEAVQAAGPGEQERRDAVVRAVEALRASLIPLQKRVSPSAPPPPVAEKTAPKKATSSTTLSIGAGVHLITTHGMSCDQDSDMVGCTNDLLTFGGVHLLPALRVGDYFSAGLHGALDWGSSSTTGLEFDGTRTESSHRMIRGTATGALFPFRDAGLWLGLEAGLVAMTRSTTTRTAAGDKSEASKTVSGPAFGGGFGYEASFSPAVAAGFDLRLLYLAIHEQAGTGEGWSYGERVWFTGGVSLIFRIPL